MGRFTKIPENAFSALQLDAGVLLNTFDPASPTITDSAIICATTGGITVACTPTYSDFGEDVDNCPNNLKEMKHLDGWECKITAKSLGTSVELIRLALGAADVTVATGKIVPRRNLSQSDFADLWWVGDKADGGFVAVRMINGLSTGGFNLATTKNGKGQIDMEITGHVSIDAQDTMPMEFYSIDGDGLTTLRLFSVGGASGKTTISASGYTPSSSESYKYKLASAPVSVTYEQVLNTGWTSWDGSSDITATTGQYITVAVVVTSSSKAMAAGSVMVTATAS